MASSPQDKGKSPEVEIEDILALNSDACTLQKVQESMLQRFENKEKRDMLQRQEDFRVPEQIVEDWFKQVEALFREGSRKDSQKGQEKVTIPSSNSSDDSTLKSNHRSLKERHDSG